MTVKDTAERVGAIASEKLNAAGEKIQDAGAHIRDAASSASASASEGLAIAKEKVVDAYGAAVDRTGTAYEGAREKAGIARDRAADGLHENPLAAVVGGIALGVLIGAVLPRSQRETEALAPLGEKLANIAKDALSAAKVAGTEKLDELGLNKEGARDQVNKLVESATEVASSAGSAAAGTLRQTQS